MRNVLYETTILVMFALDKKKQSNKLR